MYFRALFLIIIVLAVFFRFFQLGVNPQGFTWDEASLGYNSYSLLKTGSDEYGAKFPLSIRSFDDYKPPLYAYLSVPFISLFDLNEMSTRVLSALCGVVAVFAIYFLVIELLCDFKERKNMALLSSFFLAISPWHLQFSRAAFEGNIGLTFLLLGLLFFYKGLQKGMFLIASSFFFLLSIYSYHSFRLVVPLLFLFMGYYFAKKLLRQKNFLIIALAFFILFAIPVYINFLLSAKGTGSRLTMVTVFQSPDVINKSIQGLKSAKAHGDLIGEIFSNRRVVFAQAIVKGYLDHFNPDFLFLHGDSGVQHHAVDMGMLYLWDLPFILIGAYSLIRKRNAYINLFLAAFLLAPLPASITTGTPHPVRAIALLPGFILFSSFGVYVVSQKILLYKNVPKYLLLLCIGAFFVGNCIYYFYQYYVKTPIEYGYFWQVGNKDALALAKKNEAKYQKIIMTYQYDQPYIYYLFYNKIDPSWYQRYLQTPDSGPIERFYRKIGKYEFKNIDYLLDSKRGKTLLIGTPSEIPETVNSVKVIYFKVIYFPDGRVAFRIVQVL